MLTERERKTLQRVAAMNGIGTDTWRWRTIKRLVGLGLVTVGVRGGVFLTDQGLELLAAAVPVGTDEEA